MAELPPLLTENPADPPPGIHLETPSPAADSVPTENPAAEIDSPCRFFLEGRCRFGARCHNPHPNDTGNTLNLEGYRPTSQDPSPQHSSGKKPAMKTAEDVISRLLWDTQVPAECFTIGYLDRFLGILEQPFTAFSWEDLASAGPGVLAIPKHRIQYFKYGERVVWDKASRTDDVFGSTGSGRTILQVIKEEATASEAIRRKTSEAGGKAVESGMAGRSVEEAGKVVESGMVGQSVEEAELSEPVLSVNQEDESIEDEEETETSESRDGRRFRDCKERPTHFVAIQITSAEIREAVGRFQTSLCKLRPDLAKFCMPLATLHLTLCLLRLDTPEEIYRAVEALRELQANSRRMLPPTLLLSFQGVDTFNSRVLYMCPAPVTELGMLARLLEDTFQRKDLTVIHPPSKDKFHLTVVKTPAGKRGPQLPADSSWIPPIEDLGMQVVDAICLCEVGRARRADGVYTPVLKLDLY